MPQWLQRSIRRQSRALPSQANNPSSWPYLTNRLCAQPAAMTVTPAPAGASGDTGLSRLVVVPSPSWPLAL
jgi:hypothetical protein